MNAPWPPGSVQDPPTAQQLLGYLEALGTWIDAQRTELDRIDAKVQAATDNQAIFDMTTTLTIWQTIKDRYTDLLRVWDSGRVIDADLKKLAVMIWSNLNDMLTPGTTLSAGGGLSVSLPEACRMLEALVTQLGARHQLSQVPTEVSARVRGLRAQVERIKDQADLDPPQVRALTTPAIADLDEDVAAMVSKSDRGADIGGLLGPLEIRAAQLERDLIVNHAQRVQLRDSIAQVSAKRQALIERARAISALVTRTRHEVTPAPKYAVPRVEALGDVPTSADLLSEYNTKLDQVTRALNQIQAANETALKAKIDLLARLEKAHSATMDTNIAQGLAIQAKDLLAMNPVPIDVVTPLVTAYEASVKL